MNKWEIAGVAGLTCLAIIALMTAWFLIGGFILMLAWNAFLPPLFGVPVIAYWQAVAGLVLLTLIGGAFRSNTTVQSK